MQINTKSVKIRVDALERGSQSHNVIIVVRREDETSVQATEREIVEGRFTANDYATRPLVVFDEADFEV
jgi:hypothetical protein